MLKIKLFAMVLLLSSLLIAGNPQAIKTEASDFNNPAPAVVFVQDKNDTMLIKHNFEYDNGISIPWNTNMDPGFSVSPQMN